MKKNYFLFVFLSLFFLIFLISCEPGKKNYCRVTDHRFECSGYIGLDDNYIEFTKVPEGVFTLQKPHIEYDDKIEDGLPLKIDCTEVIKESEVFNGIKKNKKYYFDCIPKEKGRYTMYIKIMHAEPSSYQPKPGETCLLMDMGYQRRWNCTTTAFYSYTVK